MFIEKIAEVRCSDSSSCCLLRRRDARIRHHPIGNEMSLEKSLGKPERLRPGKKQFLGLLNFFLSLRVEFVHSIRLWENRPRIVAVHARMSNGSANLLRRN